ncbi:MAG: tetratricopeptide repeat protein [Phycisphaerales bacterium]
MRRGIVVAWALGASLLAWTGCSSQPKPGPYSTLDDGDRSTARAEALTRQAVEAMDKDQKEAERLLREALTADLWFGPAHNDLGVLCLRQGRLYEAANEFEWARKTMPGHPNPRFNLALTLERAGRADEAIAMYETALEVYPGHVQSEQALARLIRRSGIGNPRLDDYLRDVELRGETEEWREWARKTLALRRE